MTVLQDIGETVSSVSPLMMAMGVTIKDILLQIQRGTVKGVIQAEIAPVVGADQLIENHPNINTISADIIPVVRPESDHARNHDGIERIYFSIIYWL